MTEMFIFVPTGEPIYRMWPETLAHTDYGCKDALIRAYGKAKAFELMPTLTMVKVEIRSAGEVPRAQWEGR